MFANLKNKLIEEVKASPSKFQQFANAAQAAVSSSSSTTPSSSDSNNTTATSENFFSITEEDTPQNSPFRPQKLPLGASLRARSSTQSLNNGGSGGAVSRTRKLSNSSMASDVSFRLPSYDAPAVYHLQSDFDASGSEMEDSASTTRLDVITKEQLYDAYKKSLDRYNKYRCRYTDLAKKYKDLEHDSSKARSVLVETQEKAIRRISELREQCTLEQQAKAHLEEALRIEMDDMNCKMQAYQTKLKLLGENPENISAAIETDKNESLIDLGEQNEPESNGTQTTTTTTTSVNDSLLKKIADLEQELLRRETDFEELSKALEISKATIAKLSKQEEENVLLLAQTKQAIHTELEHKETEVKQLQNKLKKLESELEASSSEKETLLGDSKEQLKKLQTAKQEADAKLIATEHVLNSLKVDYAAKDKKIATLEEQLKSDKAESEQNIHELRQHNIQLNEMVQRYQQNEVSLAEVDNELNRTKNDNDILRATLAESEQRIREIENVLQAERETIAAINAEKAEGESILRSTVEQQTLKIEQLEREILAANREHGEDHTQNENIRALKEDLEKATEMHNTKINEIKVQLDAKEKELKSANNKISKQKKQYEQQQSKLSDLNSKIDKLKSEVTEREEKLQKALQIEAEKNELQERVNSILQEISSMQEHMQQVEQSHTALESEKSVLESKIELMMRQQKDVNVDTERLRELWQQSEERAQTATTELDQIKCENTKLSERNCSLEELNNHLEKQLSERERQYASSESACISELRLKLQTAEDDLAILNEKMKQVLDENSRMHNTQELMDHDHRTLQDKCDALEKEKLISEDALKCAQSDLQTHEETKTSLEAELVELKRLEQANANALAQLEVAAAEIPNLKTQLETQKELLAEREATILTLQTKLQETDEEQTRKIEALKDLEQNLGTELATLRNSYESTVKELQEVRSIEQDLNSQLAANKSENVLQLAKLEKNYNADVERLQESNVALQKEIETVKKNYQLQLDELQKALATANDAEKISEEQTQKLERYDEMQIEIEYLNKHAKQLETELALAKETTQAKDNDSAELKEKLKSLQCELYVLQENAEQHTVDLKEKITLYEAANNEVSKLKILLEEQQVELTRQSEHANFVTQQSDSIQKELLQTQNQLTETQIDLEKSNLELAHHKDEVSQLKAELEKQNELLRNESSSHNVAMEALNSELNKINEELTLKSKLIEALNVEAAERELIQKTEAAAEQQKLPPPVAANADAENLRSLNEQLQRELEDLKYKSSAEKRNLQQEIDDLQINNKEMAERIMELEKLRAGLQAQKILLNMGGNSVETKDDDIIDKEKTELELKLKEIMHEVQDVNNRNLFLEQKCQNYLIIEQSNERLKLQNAKLSRQLDETLVSMQHNEGITANTEFEYLKNIMFQYLTGNTNNETLVKVIAAVLKFSPQQQQVALEKENQRRSLLNKIL